MKKYEVIESTSEQKILIFGENLKKLFEHALLGMFEPVKPIIFMPMQKAIRNFKVEGIDKEDLLVNFLNEALYLSLSNKEAYFDVIFDVLKDKEALGQLTGYKITGFKEAEIKAVTHHGIDIKYQNGLYSTSVIFDI